VKSKNIPDKGELIKVEENTRNRELIEIKKLER